MKSIELSPDPLETISTGKVVDDVILLVMGSASVVVELVVGVFVKVVLEVLDALLVVVELAVLGLVEAVLSVVLAVVVVLVVLVVLVVVGTKLTEPCNVGCV